MKQKLALFCGMLGCLCFGGGDWLMIYGDTAHSGAVSWLIAGTALIPGWRYNLAMALAFPGIILYNLYGKEYDDYCKRVNRCIPWKRN